MKVSNFVKMARRAIQKRRNILVAGAAGIGKTELILQAVEAEGADVLISHAVTANPIDAKGMPTISKCRTFADFVPFADLRRAMDQDPTKTLVWFLDDFGQAPESVQASFMQLILGRKINGHKIPDSVCFFVATNRKQDRAGVRAILEPVKSRFVTLVELEPDVESWSDWALAKLPDSIHTATLVAFLRFSPDQFFIHAPTADLTNSASPRTWKHASDVLEDFSDLGATVLDEMLIGAVGADAFNFFDAFRKIQSELPTIDSILDDPNSFDLSNVKPSVLWAIITALGMRANAGNFAAVGRFAERLVEGHGEFAAMLVRDVIKRDPTIQNTPAFTSIITGDLGDLVAGN